MFAWFSGSSTRAPVLLKFRSSKTLIILTVATAVFTDVFVYGIIVPVIPFSLRSRVGVKHDVTQQWISIFLAVYGAALLMTAPITGWFADRTSSRRLPMILGLFALGGATVILCLAKSIAVLAVGRVLQGISATIPWVVGLALLVDTVGTDGIGQAMGYVGLSMSLSFLVAPLLGGVVFAKAGYYAVFAMAFGLISFDIFLRVVMIEKKVAARWLPVESTESKPENLAIEDNRKFDTDLELDNNEADEAQNATETPSKKRPELNSSISAAEEIVPAQAPTFVKRLASRLPPVVFLLSSRRLLSAIWGCMIQSSLFTAFDTILPLYVRDTFHWSSVGAGLIFLPIVVVSFSGPLFG